MDATLELVFIVMLRDPPFTPDFPFLIRLSGYKTCIADLADERGTIRGRTKGVTEKTAKGQRQEGSNEVGASKRGSIKI